MSTISMEDALRALQDAGLFDTPQEAATAGAIDLLTPNGGDGTVTTTTRLREVYDLQVSGDQPRAVAA